MGENIHTDNLLTREEKRKYIDLKLYEYLKRRIKNGLGWWLTYSEISREIGIQSVEDKLLLYERLMSLSEGELEGITGYNAIQVTKAAERLLGQKIEYLERETKRIS